MEQRGECDVCVLAREDRTRKLVAFCDLCGAWLCARCRKRYDLRAIAMVKSKAKELIAKLQSKEK